MFSRFHIPTRLLPFVPTIALVFGFFFDLLTLNQPDALFENVVIIGYLLISAIIILLLLLYREDTSDNKRLLLMSILQFSFGNLASALMILYAHSGTLAGNAIFVGMLALLLLGNEIFRKRYARTYMSVVIWFALLLTYSGLIVPIIFNKIGTPIFIASALFALAIAYGYIRILGYIGKESFKKTQRNSVLTIVIVTLVFSVLYFSNLIPPVPLSLKHIGVYHDVVREGDRYALTYETPRWFAFWRATNASFTQKDAEATFCFTSVYAPNKLATDIRHRWEKYDAITDSWNTVARIPFPITGGRKDGFRGYTQTSQVTEGLWRCSVETARGALIGRTQFTVETGIPKLETIEL